ncbi:hypothetical protein [Rhodococcus sp. 14-2483-1-2]|uniref:hypothetical protein n=1 Tax=Rhodococcus sp. 14-2483-1-2 TaxID=2023147 RepID=UPI000B9ABDC7|nr:hypothetical protein [Rhodococcus sp. 14-2483-1-2]OZF25981.1 hypothetical protein CH295_25375 [Rhodococcus sp. 14-2483-1-2]
MVPLLIPVLTAAIAAIAVLSAAGVARNATRYAARLGALQKAHDANYAALESFRQAFIESTNLVQRYTFHVPFQDRLRTRGSTREQFDQNAPWYEPALLSVQKLRALSHTVLLSDTTNALYKNADDVFRNVLSAERQTTATDPWLAAMADQPDPLTRCIEALGADQRALLEAYPVDVPRRRKNDQQRISPG